MSGPLSWVLGEVAAATSGRVDGPDVTVTSISTDSRTLTPDALFVALSGDRFDGHDFAADAIANGAAGVLVATGRASSLVPRVTVVDPRTALRDLAVLRRSELSVPVVAVTGSTGKTSTKDILAHILPEAWASPASYNNEIGVPLTVLSTPRDARVLVVEVGSRGTGHIALLVPAIRPDVAVITNLGIAHFETFGSKDKLASAKRELVAGLGSGGVAVLPFDEPRLTGSYPGRTLTFGADVRADVSFSDLEVDRWGRPGFTMGFDGDTRPVDMAMAGAHQAYNATAAAAAAIAIGLDLDSIVAGLQRATGSEGRMEIHQGSVTVVNDAYNANPDSMAAALRTVATMPGRHVAVLGLMAELGEVAEREHVRIGELVRSLGFAAVIVVGDEPGIAVTAGRIARKVEDGDEALRVLEGFRRDGDVVLVKASHSVGLEALAMRLVEEVNA